ncbi:enolase C-terminal domain-like protein [Marispirochaeta aestuarii]|uniref:enolase C-terminal domain-like protein n=1 Tax=Marispirochaeta aestuarii TaxID=1963862 RepID=UPI0018E9F256|nr:enolase C-terminal domain-like protein [Marispirochaeta aestuarii]
MSRIERVEVFDFTYIVENIGIAFQDAHNHVGYLKGGRMPMSKYAIIIVCDDGSRGEYVTQWGGTRSALAQTLQLVADLPGRDPDEREFFYKEWNRRLCHTDHMGQGPVDIALWDLAGKQSGKSVADMIGRYRSEILAYASTYHGDHTGMLDSYDAYCDFAVQCREMGYKAFKHHGWFEGDAKVEATLIQKLREQIGESLTLMYDAASDLQTFGDALYVGRACDDAEYFWYEDPYKDNSMSSFSHRKLRSLIKTPLLITEHVRALESKCDFILADGTDFVRTDPEYDMGITGAIKTARMAEAFGLDVEVHACGPAHRQVVGAVQNTNFYEIATVGPKLPNILPPCYACGYKDDIDSIGADGCVPIPDDPGLGVVYDWDWLNAHTTQRHVFSN